MFWCNSETSGQRHVNDQLIILDINMLLTTSFRVTPKHGRLKKKDFRGTEFEG